MLEGRCLCGAITYEIDGEVGPIGLCHCSYCRRASGSAFAANATIRSEDFRLTAGEAELREYESTPGKLRSFCSRCGSPIYARLRAAPQVLRIRAGTLLSDPGARPRGHYDVGSKAPWYEIEGELPCFDAEGKPAAKEASG